MELTYAGFALHSVGDLTIVPTRTYEPPENPQYARVTLRVTIDIFPSNYHAGKTARDPLTAALRKQNELLLWENPAAVAEERTYLNQPANVVAEDLPEDPNAWGTKYQQVVVTFTYQERLTEDEANNLTATLKGLPGGQARSLGKVSGFRQRYEASRFQPFASERSRAVNVVSMSGRFTVDPTAAIEARRSALLTAESQLRAEAVKKDAELIYYKPADPNPLAIFQQNVRVRSFEAQIDQATNGIDWSLEVEFTEFPVESTFGTVDYQVDEQQGRADGQLRVTFTGKVQAPTELLARSELATVRATVLSGYTAYILEEESSDAGNVHSDDGDPFIELSFSETYLAFEAQTAGITSVQFAHSIDEDPASATKRVRLTGSVYGSHQLLLDCQTGETGNFLDKFVTALGVLTGSAKNTTRELSVDHEYVPSEFDDNTDTLSTPVADRAQKLDFTLEYDDTLTVAQSILECSVTEEIQYSGTRFVTHDVPGGLSVMQNTGTAPGRRRVSGSVVAVTEAAAKTWALAKRDLLTGWGNPVQNHPDPERITIAYEFPPLTSGVADDSREDGTTNVRVARVSFDFAETLVNYPAP